MRAEQSEQILMRTTLGFIRRKYIPMQDVSTIREDIKAVAERTDLDDDVRVEITQNGVKII